MNQIRRILLFGCFFSTIFNIKAYDFEHEKIYYKITSESEATVGVDSIIGKTKRIFLQKRSGSKLAKTKRTCFNVIKTKICTENSEDLTIKQQGAKTRF